jgi:hypothetical protein
MAIKRPTKGKGTPSHKPVASAPLRHVDVRASQQMVVGEAGERNQCLLELRPLGDSDRIRDVALAPRQSYEALASSHMRASRSYTFR